MDFSLDIIEDDFFSGFHCEEHDNPADFFLDVVTSCEKVGNIEGDSGFQGRSL